jgi:hypothetical protein
MGQGGEGQPNLGTLWNIADIYYNSGMGVREQHWEGKDVEHSGANAMNTLHGKSKKWLILLPNKDQAQGRLNKKHLGIYKSKQLGIIIQLSTVSPTERHFFGRKRQ